MPDNRYCYPGSDVLINKLNITSRHDLFEAEKRLTFVRLQELQESPVVGDYDFAHLKAIHKYIFQDIYEWAGEERTVEIGKGNLFCTTACIQDYARSVFNKYLPQCLAAKDDLNDYVKAFADNYGDLNALHPFREGNGRAQREFARLICLKCGYDFDLSCASHNEMLEASRLSFDKADSSLFIQIFSKALTPHEDGLSDDPGRLNILTFDDLTIGVQGGYDHYGYNEHERSAVYNELYRARIVKMDAEKNISDAMAALRNEP